MRKTLVYGSLVSSLAFVAACTTAETAGSGKTAAAHAIDCDGASLALGDDRVIAVVNGKNITVKDLGNDAKEAEKHALYAYCDAVFTARAEALDNYITQQLVDAAGKAAGKTGDEWMQQEVMKRAPIPSDQEVQAFYDARKRPDAPPLEAVKDQVVMVMQREKTEDAVKGVLDSLKSGAAVENKLPDVRSPPRDIPSSTHTATHGTAAATVKIVEFADFQCPYCSHAADTVRELAKKYGDKVEISYRNFPLRSIHPNAQRAAEVGQCAGAQGKFWEMSDKMYSDQDKLDDASLHASAQAVGVDVQKLDQCLTSGKGAAEVEEDLKVGNDLGVQGTPTFYVNGRQHLGSPSVEALSAVIDAALKS